MATTQYKFEYENMEFSKDGQLDELIVLDRYAIPTYDGYAVGDTVVFIADELMETKRVGVIKEIYDDGTYKVRDRFGEEHTVRKELMHKPLELKPSQLWTRWAKGAASVEKTKELQEYWENEFRWLFDGYRYSLGGRIQLMLGQEFVTGKKANLTAYNCFSGDTIVQTKQGAKFIKDLKGEVEVLSKDGIYRKAYFKDYGVQELFEIELENGETLKATAGHEWIVISKGGKYTKVTTLELEGKRIPVIGNKRNFDKKSKEVLEGIRHGIYYGDGTVNKNHNNKPSGHLLLFGEKRELVKYFEGYHIVEHHEGKYLGIYGINPNLKQLPTDDKSDEYWYGFIIGLIATDGYVDNRGSVMLHSSNINDLKTIIKNLYKTGFVYSSLKMSREINPYNGEKSPNYKLQFVKQTVKEDDLLRSSHKDNFINSSHTNKAYTIKVVKVRPLNISETVYCCEEPETHSFVVGTGYLTGNCYVVKSPEGKETPVEQFLEVLNIAYKEASIMRRGGGVGLNISYINTVKGSGRTKKFFKLLLPETHKDFQELLDKQKLGKFDAVEVITKLDRTIKPEQYIEVEDSVEGLFAGVNEMVVKAYNPSIDELVIDFSNIRHRNAIVKGVNGRSSGAVSWMELYVLIAKLLQQETIDNVEFAEIYSFIVHLIIQGGTRRGALMLVCNVDNQNIRKFITRKRTFGYLSGANISVGIDDTFMDKVKKAKELIKAQNVVSTDLQEAHDLWMLIIESAWSSAEPGVIFMERYNKESNSYYFHKVIATNPLLA